MVIIIRDRNSHRVIVEPKQPACVHILTIAATRSSENSRIHRRRSGHAGGGASSVDHIIASGIERLFMFYTFPSECQ